MSFAEVLDQLPALTVSQRQLLVRRVLELDELPLSLADEKVVEERLAIHRLSPDSAVSMEQMKTRLRSRFSK